MEPSEFTRSRYQYLRRGALIELEGIDQSGKETQVSNLARRLRGAGYNTVTISFPDYSTPVGRQIRAFLAKHRSFPLQLRHMLFAANRWEKAERIEAWLKKGRMVVADRYSMSNLAYGVASALPLRWLMELERGLPRPDLVLVIDISPKTSLRRKKAFRDIHESDLRYLAKVRRAYVGLARRFRWKIVYGEREAEAVEKEVWRLVRGFLKRP